MAVGEGAGDLGRGREQERGLLVDEDGREALCGRDGLGGGGGQSQGRKGGVDGRLAGREVGRGRGQLMAARLVRRGAVEGVASSAARGGHVG